MKICNTALQTYKRCGSLCQRIMAVVLCDLQLFEPQVVLFFDSALWMKDEILVEVFAAE